MTKYYGTLTVIFVACMFWMNHMIDHALWAPLTSIIMQLTGG